MGSARPRPRRLAEKLLQIRFSLGLSQKKMVKFLGVEGQINYTNISKYELNKNEPPLEILLAYARAARVHLEEIVDDKLDLPRKLPGKLDYDAATHKSQKHRE
jgi:transcriptional regulator with XRE-family HTH domain